MKRLIIAICTLLISCLWAYSEEIKLKKVTERHNDHRSILIIPSADLDGNIITLYSSIPLEHLQITIKDETAQVISEEIIDIQPQQSYTFSIENIENRVYTLELTNGEEQYIGYFEISQ